MSAGKKIAVFPEPGAIGPVMNLVGIGQGLRDLGHECIFVLDPGLEGARGTDATVLVAPDQLAGDGAEILGDSYRKAHRKSDALASYQRALSLAPDNEEILGRIRELRDGKLNSTSFGERMKGRGQFADQVRALFATSCRKHGLKFGWPETSTAAFRVPGSETQLALFGDP